jgi:hypothetical protein
MFGMSDGTISTRLSLTMQIGSMQMGDGQRPRFQSSYHSNLAGTLLQLASPDAGPREYVVGDLYHRSLVEVVKEKLRNSVDMDYFHYELYELNWQLGNSPEPIRVHGELYTSQAFIDVHNTLQNSPPEPRCNLPRNIIALMFYSDSTHLTAFGDASLWPLYLYFGNESKYQ